MPKTMGLIEVVALIGLGIIIENPEKRRKVIGTLDKAGNVVEKTIKDFAKGGVPNAPISRNDETE